MVTLAYHQPVPRVRKSGPPRDCPDSWKVRVREWFARPGAPTKIAVAAALHCDPSSLTVLLRLVSDDPPGPSTSVLAKPLADFTGIPLPQEGLSEFAEAAEILRQLQKLNPDKAAVLIEGLSDALAAERLRSSNRFPVRDDNPPDEPAGEKTKQASMHRRRRR
jgi:hypothetical protein